VLASRHEGYGMAYAEAVARGLPVVGTTAGAIAEAVPAGAGRLVPPDDVDALRAALRTFVVDAGARACHAAAARAAAATQVRWTQTAARVADALRAST
jgi:glycosyltransferase involved in cell wall biosynthesis